jgi:hypothetical protein
MGENSLKSIYQSKVWADIKEKSGLEIVPVDGVLAFSKAKYMPLAGKIKILFAEGTPSYDNEWDLLEKLENFKLKSENYFYGLISPSILDTKEDVFLKAGFKKVSNHTVLIDLSLGEEELWKNLEKKSMRWGVKTGEKNKLKFSIASKKDVKDFYKSYLETCKSGGFYAEEKEFLEGLRDSEISKLFVVKSKGKIVAGGLILIDERYNYSILNLTSASVEGLKLQAMPFLYWEMIKYCKSLALDKFDLGGYDADAKKGEKMHNINKFKERLGGEIVEQPFFATKSRYPILRKLLKFKKSLPVIGE